MTVIKTTCPICGDVTITPSVVRLVIHPDPDRSHYVFTCPVCDERVTKAACEQIIQMLVRVGIVPERIVIPAEALEEHAGRPVTWDDVLDFRAGLDGTSDLVAVLTREAAA